MISFQGKSLSFWASTSSDVPHLEAAAILDPADMPPGASDMRDISELAVPGDDITFPLLETWTMPLNAAVFRILKAHLHSLPLDDTCRENVIQDIDYKLARVVKHLDHKIKSRRHRAWKSGWITRSPNNVVIRLGEELTRLGHEAELHARSRLLALVGEIASMEGILASTCGLFMVTERKTLKAEVVLNASKYEGWETDLDSPGIVPRVARLGLSVFTDNCDPDYLAENPKTRSEMAVAIVNADTVVGVLNLESIADNAFDERALALVESKVSSLIPHLLVLRSLESDPGRRLPWHPERHGWDLQELVGRLCRGFMEEVGKATTKTTVWYIDAEKGERFAYGTSGYDWAYHQTQRTLASCGNCVERLIQSGEELTITLTPSTEQGFLSEDKARLLEISHGLFRPVFDDNGGGTRRVIAGITVYFNSVDGGIEDSRRDALVEDALPEFCVILGRLIAVYEKQRCALASAVLRAEEGRLGNCAIATKLEIVIQSACDILRSPAASLFAYDVDAERLRCVASTGLRATCPSSDGTVNARDMCFEKEVIEVRDRNSHTIAALCNRGAAFHRNRLGYSGERGLPSRCPELGGSSRPEFIAGENVADGEHGRRRFLGCAVLANGKEIGVLRVVRPEKSPPYTRCDDRLVEEMCDGISSLLERRILDTFGENEAAILQDYVV